VSLPNLLWFYRRRLRARLVQELFALLGIAVGVALLFAVQVSSTSLNASIADLTREIVGDAQVQLLSRGPDGFSQDLVQQVRELDGVKAAEPVLQVQANAVGPQGARAVVLLAATPGLARLGGDLLSGYADGGLSGLPLRAVILPTSVSKAVGVHFAGRIRLEVSGHSRAVPVGAVVNRDDVGPLAGAPAIVAPLTYAQSLAGMSGRVSRVYVLAKPGREATVEAGLRRLAAGRLDVRPASSDGRVFQQAAVPNDRSAALFAGISAFVGFLFAFNAMLLMARERRGVIADLRMAGYGSRSVLQVLFFDALVLGAVASALGIALGDQLSRHVFHPSPGYLSIAFPVGVERTVHWQIVALAFGCGMLAAVLAMLPPLIAASRASAMDATDDSSLERSDASGSAPPQGRLLLSFGCLAVTTAILLAAPGAALVGVLTLVASMLLALPAILSGTIALLDRVRRRITSVVPAIAIGELMSAGSRSAAIAAIAAIAVFSHTAIEGAHRDLQRGLDPNARELNAVTDLWVSPAGASNTLATTPFPAAAATAKLAREPAVRSVGIYRGSFLDIGDRRVWVIAPPRAAPRPIPPSQIVEGSLDRAVERLAGSGWAVVSQALADTLQLQIGERFTLPTPRPARFRLAAITTNFGWSPGAIVMNADDYRRAWGSSAASALHVELRGVATAHGRQLVQAALGPGSGLAVETPGQRELRDRDVTRQGLARLTQIARLVLIAAALAMAAAMSGMVWQRRRRLADLKLAGINYRELWKAVLLESALLLGIGCVVGAVYGLYGEQLLDRALSRVTGFPVDYSVDVFVAITTVLVVTAVASLIAMLPGWFAARVSADVALRD
jgi:putative ABC transport system permease protein